MKHLNFFSKSSSRSCGHSSVTLASTVGSPSAHRRGAMLRLLSVLAIILTIGVGNVWGGNNTPAPAGTYNLVTNASNLAAGDVIIITSTTTSGTGYAISTTQNNNNRGQASVTISNNAITIPANNSTVQGITLEAGTTNGTLSFKVGDNGYLYAASSNNNYLKTESTKSANSSWTISISNNNATVTAQGTNSRKLMRHNSSSSLFACYETTTSTGTAVRIYKKAVETKTLSSITITGDLLDKTYEESDDLDYAGLTATGTYSDASTKDITSEVEWSFSPTLTTEVTSVTVTATVGNISGNKTINEITVTQHVVTPGTYDIVPSNALWGTSFNGSVSGTDTYSGTQNDITLTYAKGSGSYRYINDSQTRFYPNNTLVISVPAGFVINSVVFTGSTWPNAMSANVGTMSDSKNWSGKAQSITFTGGGSSNNNQCTKITVTYEAACTELGQINGSISWTQTTATVTWDKKADVGNWAVTYKTDAGSETSTNVTITSPDPDASHKRAVITGLTPNTHYTIYVKATNATGYCETAKTWDYNGTTNAPYTITYKDKGNVNFSGTHESGYPTTHVYGTATTLKSATKTGYDFSGWFTAQDCSGSAITEVSSSQNANITLYAKWTAHQHTLTWNFNEGGTSSSSYTTGGTKDYGSTITYPANNTMSKVGYTFANWTSSPSGNPTTMPDADLTITANWTANANTAYTVKHYKQKLDGTYDATPDETDNLAGTTAASVTPARKSYDGFTAPAGQLVTILADGSLVVEYQYTRNSYTLAWDANGGDALSGDYSSGSIKFGAAITAPTTPTKTNFLFSGWHDGTSVVTPATTMPAGALTYTAQWVADNKWGVSITAPENGTITVSWTDGEGDHSFTSGSQEIDKNAEISITAVAANGYSAPAKVVVNDGELNNGGQMTLTSSIVISATFSLQTYTITYNLDEGTNHGDNPANYNITSSDISLGAPSKIGYTFLGWYNNSDLAEGHKVTGTAIASGSTGNKEFWAKWQINSHTLVWDLDGGSIQTAGTAAGSVNYGTALVAPIVSKTGYTFNGWSPSVDATMPDNDVTYIAQWNVNSYSVTWMISGNEWTTDGQSSVNYGSSVTDLPTPPDPADYCGDKFMGWTTDAVFTLNTSPLYTSAGAFPNATGAQTFYAVFADYTK